MVYGDTRGGSRGMRAAIVSTRPEPILAAVDRDGGSTFEPVSHDATLTSHSGIAAALRFSGPATLVAGEPADLHLAAVDLYENPVAQFREEVALRVLQGDVELPTARCASTPGAATGPSRSLPTAPASSGSRR